MTDLSGRPLDPVDGAVGYRINKAGRRVLVDSLGSEIRRGSRRPVGRVSTENWIRLPEVEKRAWDKKLKEERDLAAKYGFTTKDTDTAFVDTVRSGSAPRDEGPAGSGLAPRGDDAAAVQELSEEPTSDDDEVPSLLPMSVATGKARHKADAAKRRKQKQKSEQASSLPAPGGGSLPVAVKASSSTVAPTPGAASSSDDALGSAHSGGVASAPVPGGDSVAVPRRKKTSSPQVGIFAALSRDDSTCKRGGHAFNDTDSDIESTCVGSDRDVLDLTDASDNDWQSLQDFENESGREI